MKLAEKIMNLRKQKGWSQEDLAGRLGISRQSVSKWESEGSVPDLDKILKLSELFQVSTDYLLKEDAPEEPESIRNGSAEADQFNSYGFDRSDYNVSYIIEEKETGRPVTQAEAEDYLAKTRGVVKKIALAVAMFIISPVCLIVLGALSEYKPGPITENMAACIGLIVLFGLIAAGVVILVLTEAPLKKYHFIEEEVVDLSESTRAYLEEHKETYEPTYHKGIAFGTALCILAVVPLVAAAAFEVPDLILVYLVALLLMLIAIGVYAFICVGTIYGSFQKLLQEDDYTVENKKIRKKNRFFPGIYWCTVTAIYLGISFYQNNWEISWIIWPVAGVFFAAVCGVVHALTLRKLS